VREREREGTTKAARRHEDGARVREGLAASAAALQDRIGNRAVARLVQAERALERQAHGAAARALGGGTVPMRTVGEPNRARPAEGLGAGRPLDEVTRGAMERGFGEPFTDVRVHDDAGGAAHAKAHAAAAVTSGAHIAFRDKVDASSGAGRKLIAHELAHVVQQRWQPGLHPQRRKRSRAEILGDLEENEKHVDEPGAWEERQQLLAELKDAQDSPDEPPEEPPGPTVEKEEEERRKEEERKRAAAKKTAEKEEAQQKAEREAEKARKLAELRDHLARGESDVDDLSDAMDEETMGELAPDERLQLISRIANGYVVGDDDEQALIRLVKSTKSEDAKALLEGMRKDDAKLLMRLRSMIDGEESKQFHEAVRELYLRSATVEETMAHVDKAPVLVWDSPELIDSLKEGRHTYAVTVTSEGKIHLDAWESWGIWSLGMGKQYQAVDHDLDPFEMVAVEFRSGEEVLGGEKGQVVYMPAYNFLLLADKAFKQDLEMAGNTAMVVGGVSGVVTGTTRLAIAIASTEAALGAANFVVDNYRSELTKTPAGQRLLQTMRVLNLLAGAYSLGKVVKAAPQTIKSFREAWVAFKEASGALDPKTAAEIEKEVGQLARSIDEAQAATAESASSATAAPGSAKVPEGGEPGAVKAPEGGEPGAAKASWQEDPEVSWREATPEEEAQVLTAERERLRARGLEFQGELKNHIAEAHSTTAVAPAIGPDGKVVDLVASTITDPAQRALLQQAAQPGEILIENVGGHADLQLPAWAKKNGYTLLALEPSRPFCAVCAIWTRRQGLTLPGAEVAGRPKPVPLEGLSDVDLARMAADANPRYPVSHPMPKPSAPKAPKPPRK
jgi:hypothetical protein